MCSIEEEREQDSLIIEQYSHENFRKGKHLESLSSGVNSSAAIEVDERSVDTYLGLFKPATF